jgi:transcriptional regulator with XRE-family HTH domain
MGEIPRGQRRRFARRLKMDRLASRLTLEEVCREMEFSTSKLNRIESGENLISLHELKSLLDLYGITADRWPEYFELRDAARQPGWWRSYGLDDRGYVSLEHDASEVHDFTLNYMPGLLQTIDYARAVFGTDVVQRSTERLSNELKVRMVRQRRLTSLEDPLRLVAIMDESVLHRPVGGSDVMAAQLARLLHAATWPSVTLQVLPTGVGAHAGLVGSFSVLSFGELGEPDVVYVEHAVGAVQSEKSTEVGTATLLFDRLRSDALSPDDSIALIRRMAERYGDPPDRK